MFRFICITLGLFLRLVALQYLNDFFELSPEFVTPLNSFKNFKEGVFLYDFGIANVYDSNIFHLV